MRSNVSQEVGSRPPTQLYIIGNGFDLWHGIPSAYKNFKEYVRHHDRELFRAVEEFLPAGVDWSSLEAALAEIDVDNIIDNLSQFMPSYGSEDWSDSGHHDFQYEVEQLVRCLSSTLKERFGDWIRTLPIPVRQNAPAFLHGLNKNARFLTFNYTSTLQDLYDIPDSNVLHIHGAARIRDDDLILGHAWNPAHRPSLNDRNDIDEVDNRLVEANHILDGYFERTFKPSRKLIRQHQGFFDNLQEIDTVHVLGHSLSDVDLPYLHALLRTPSIANAQWHVACRERKDQAERRERLIEIGVDPKHAVADLWAQYSNGGN